MNKRYLGAILISPMVIFIFLGGILLKIGVLLLSLGGLFEFYKVSRKKGIKPLTLASYGATLVYFFTLDSKYISNPNYYKYLFGILVFSTLVLMCYIVVNNKFNYNDIAVTILGFLYVTIFFSYIVLVNQKQNGNLLVWLIFISSWLCDTGAYYSGKFFGRHKLIPKVSPNKTVEGAIGGLFSSAIACFLFGIFFNMYSTSIKPVHFLFIGLICGVLCQFGDLIASSIKRYIGVKDFSNLIPGHGGILDRFDSILFASVVVYYYITFILGM